MEFVTVRDLRFFAGDHTFYVAGANCYYCLTRAASEGKTRKQVEDVLDRMQRMGLNVLRTWAFGEGPGWNHIQPRPGEFDEKVFKGLDWLLDQAHRRGIRLILSLCNYWNDYGGMQQYVRWSLEAQRKTVPETQLLSDLFYKDSGCQRLFQRYLRTLVNRANTINGRRYRDDPTIMAWELANEPRCHADPSGHTLQAWLEGTSKFLKSCDPFHLITVGIEGFFGTSTPDACEQYNPGSWASRTGADFLCNSLADVSNVDFSSVHLWPDQWLPPSKRNNLHQQLRFSQRWLRSHNRACAMACASKPLLVGEFGRKLCGSERAQMFKMVYESVIQSISEGQPLVGAVFWMTATPDYKHDDGYTVVLPPALGRSSCRAQGRDWTRAVSDGSLTGPSSCSSSDQLLRDSRGRRVASQPEAMPAENIADKDTIAAIAEYARELREMMGDSTPHLRAASAAEALDGLQQQSSGQSSTADEGDAAAARGLPVDEVEFDHAGPGRGGTRFLSPSSGLEPIPDVQSQGDGKAAQMGKKPGWFSQCCQLSSTRSM